MHMKSSYRKSLLFDFSNTHKDFASTYSAEPNCNRGLNSFFFDFLPSMSFY